MELLSEYRVLIGEIKMVKLIKPIADVLDSQGLLTDEYQKFNLSFWIKKDKNKDMFVDAINIKRGE